MEEDENISRDPSYISTIEPIKEDKSLFNDEKFNKWCTGFKKYNNRIISNNSQEYNNILFNNKINHNNNININLNINHSDAYENNSINSSFSNYYLLNNNKRLRRDRDINNHVVGDIDNNWTTGVMKKSSIQQHQQHQLNQMNLQSDVVRTQIMCKNNIFNNNRNVGLNLNNNLNYSVNKDNIRTNNMLINSCNSSSGSSSSSCSGNNNIGSNDISNNNINSNSGIMEKNVIKTENLGVIKNEIGNKMDYNNILDDENMNLARISDYINVTKAVGTSSSTINKNITIASGEYLNESSSSSNNNNNSNYIYSSSGNLINKSNCIDNFNRMVKNNFNQKLLQYKDGFKCESMNNKMSDLQILQQDGKMERREQEQQQQQNDSVEFKEFMEEVCKSWLHFRPKTPDEIPDDKLETTESKSIVDFSENTPIVVELQKLRNDDKKKEENDPVFTTKFAYSDIITDDQIYSVATSTDSNSNSGIDFNFSGDSLNDFSLSLGGEDSEKMLENILQECQIDDIKALNQTTSFWNGILEDGGLLDVIDDNTNTNKNNHKQSTTTSSSVIANNSDIKDNIGFESDLSLNGNGQSDEKDIGNGKKISLKRKSSNRQKSGNSAFTVSNLIRNEEFFQKHEQKPDLNQTKIEPPEEILASPPPPQLPPPPPSLPVSLSVSSSSQSNEMPPMQQQKNIVTSAVPTSAPVTVLPVTVSNISGISVVNNNSSNHQSVVTMSLPQQQSQSRTQSQSQHVNLPTSTIVQSNSHHSNTILTSVNVINPNTIQVHSQHLHSDGSSIPKVYVKQRQQHQHQQQQDLNSNVNSHNTIFTLANAKVEGDMTGNNENNTGSSVLPLHSSSNNLITGNSNANNSFAGAISIEPSSIENGTNITAVTYTHSPTSAVVQHAPLIVTSKQHQQHQLQQQKHHIHHPHPHQHQPQQHQHIIVQQITQNPPQTQIINVANAAASNLAVNDGNGGTIVLSGGDTTTKRQINGPVERTGKFKKALLSL